jgi:Hypothetical protein Yqai
MSCKRLTLFNLVAKFEERKMEYLSHKWHMQNPLKEVIHMKDHPVIESMEKTGLPYNGAQPKHVGIDYYGTEILLGDEIVIDSNTGEIVLKENLEKYLCEVCGFVFKSA